MAISKTKYDRLHELESLAETYVTRKDFVQAGNCYMQAIELAPDVLSAWENLARCYMAQGQQTHAILVMSKLVKENPRNATYKNMLAASFFEYRVPTPAPELKEAIVLCLKEKNIFHEWMFRAWISYIEKAPEYNFIRELTAASMSESFSAQMEKVPASSLNDPFLTTALGVLCCHDLGLELMLRRTRKEILFLLDRDPARLESLKPFVNALAQQCFNVEYVYAVTPEEQQRVDLLRANLTAFDTPTHDLELKLLVYGCYESLAALQTVDGFAAYTRRRVKRNDNVAQTLQEQVLDFIKEEELRADIEHIGAISNDISQKVRAQYEESPYPRWRTAAMEKELIFPLDISHLKKPGKKLSVLVAGCGTGRQLAHSAQYFPGASITAIDLSTASLAYAMRKTRELGHKNIRFIHMDILDLPALGETFDIIYCSGVLHHMQDPMAGWQALCKVAAPGAIMEIALYSEAARKSVVAAREFIAAQNYPATKEGIRACRDALIRNPGPVKPLLGWSDFYTLSACRDLIFHVNEHRFTIPQIEKCLDELKLSLVGFIVINKNTAQEYRAAHPDDPKFTRPDYWHDFEQKHPDTFAGMYQFWCQTPLQPHTVSA